MRKIRRLIVCLDGTWNRQDSSTNVLQHHALVRECSDERQFIQHPNGSSEEVLVSQMRFYQPGVGTGVLDGISGGAFGLGLEKNVRAGYNWLLSNYRDPTTAAEDQVYIFGFSRGAYTARSLVGFIATCGLLRRGAPLTVEELWSIYGTLGRQKEQRGSSVSRWIGLAQSPCRRITDLMRDDAPGVLRPEVANDPQRPPTTTERLLVRWSRRVPISYLGIYDTVGAIGIDALAIPGLRGKLAMHNNVRPTSLIQRCRHALAVDEHRGPFNHTPFIAYVGDEDEERRVAQQNRAYGLPAAPTPDGGAAGVSAVELRAHQRWGQRIEQRWFAGAHSNVGGGYGSNPMAQVPLQWVQDGAPELLTEAAGLAPLSPQELRQLPPPRNSFAEFAAPWTEHLLRAKPNFRLLRPYPNAEPELRAHPDPACQAQEHGFALVSIHEVLDDSLAGYWPQSTHADEPAEVQQKCARGMGPHLYQALQRQASARGTEPPKLSAPKHDWLGQRLGAHLSALLWALLAALGWLSMEHLFRTWPELWSAPRVAVVTSTLAALFVTVDYWESRLNFALAAGNRAPVVSALRDVLYWLRAVGVAFALTGVVGVAGWLVVRAWELGSVNPAMWLADAQVRAGLRVFLGTLVGATGALLLVALIRHGRSATLRETLVASGLLFIGLPLLAGSCFLLIGRLRQVLDWSPLGISFAPWPLPGAASFAGQLLFSMGTMGLVMNSFAWASSPLAKANLGGVRDLQRALSPRAFRAQLDFWSRALGPKNIAVAEQEAALQQMLRVSLWRDFLGFMPVYFTCIAMGLRFAHDQLGWFTDIAKMQPHFFWQLPLAVVLLDVIENLIYGHHLRQRAKSPGYQHHWLIHGLLLAATWAKNIATVLLLLVVLAAVAVAVLGIGVQPADGGWRLGIALLIAVIGGLMFALGAGLAVHRKFIAPKITARAQ